jgi:hypothetical protein
MNAAAVATPIAGRRAVLALEPSLAASRLLESLYLPSMRDALIAVTA